MRDIAIVLGAGSYVIGDQLGDGVVLPSLLNIYKIGILKKIIIAVRSSRSKEYYNKLTKYQQILNLEYSPQIFIFTEISEIKQLEMDRAIAFIAVPDFEHFYCAKFFIENHVPTWIVKPLTGDAELSYKLCELSKQHDTKIWVDYHKRFDPSNLKIKQQVDLNSLGSLLMYSVQYSQPALLPLVDLKAWSKKLNVLQYIGCHYIDQIFFLYPSIKVKRISCCGLPGMLVRENGPAFDIVHCIIDFITPNDALLKVDLNISWNDPKFAPGKSHQRVDLQFEHGRIIADQKNRGMEIWTDERYDQVNPDFFQFFRDNFTKEYCPVGYGYESLKYFVCGFSGNQKLNFLKDDYAPWAESSLKTDEVLLLAEKSMEQNGNWINNLIDD